MPCNDGSWDDDVRVSRDDVREHRMLEAALCGVFTVLEATGKNLGGGSNLLSTLNAVDWEEAGIKRKAVEMWWKAHKKKDAERRERERLALEKDARKKAALAKLTDEDLKALGLK